MSVVENVVIAAAGMGTRLGAGKPKCLVDVCGRKLIEYQLDLLKNVKNVYMVVGFCELDVIDFVAKLRKDVIFVRNPNFRSTKTLESYHLAAKIINGSAIFMDGDMIFSPKDFSKFMEKTKEKDFLVGVSERITEDPVYADVFCERNEMTIHGFSYDRKIRHEWANIVYMPARFMKGGKGNVFEFLATLLPQPASILDRLEIDTPKDLEYAKQEIAKGKFGCWTKE